MFLEKILQQQLELERTLIDQVTGIDPLSGLHSKAMCEVVIFPSNIDDRMTFHCIIKVEVKSVLGIFYVYNNVCTRRPVCLHMVF